MRDAGSPRMLKMRVKVLIIEIILLKTFHYYYERLSFFIFSKEQLREICKEYHARAAEIENIKYDLEHEVVVKDYEVQNQSLLCLS